MNHDNEQPMKGNNPMKTQYLKRASRLLLPVTAAVLAGCYTVPNANVQPQGEPRLIESGIMVESVKDAATVQAIDTAAGTITLGFPNNTAATYKIGPNVKHLDQLQVGSQIKAKTTEELAVYLLADGKLPDGSTAQSLGCNAKVMIVDPSYRLLTLQYPDGSTETVKPGLGTKMMEMAAGDDVVVKPVELVKLKIK